MNGGGEKTLDAILDPLAFIVIVVLLIFALGVGARLMIWVFPMSDKCDKSLERIRESFTCESEEERKTHERILVDQRRRQIV